MKKALIFLVLLFTLISCGEELSIIELEKKKANLEKEITQIDKTIKESQTGTIIKQDFLIKTKKLSEFGGEYKIKKNGKINSSQNINLSSNSVGRINSLFVREGEQVMKGQILATIEDNIGNYGINLSKARNAVDRAKINYESNKITLDKQIFDATINLDKLNTNLIALNNDKEEALKQAAVNVENSNNNSSTSKSSLELDKINDSIEKLQFDYETKIIGDKETISGFSKSLKKDYSSLSLVIGDVIEFSDTLLGVTDENKDENDKYEDFLGAKDKGQKYISESNLRDLISFKNSEFSNIIFDDNSFSQNLLILEEGYSKTRLLLENLEQTLNNSIASVGSLGKSEIVSFIGSINIYQSTLQGNYTGFVAFSNSSKSFLKTYKLSSNSLLKQIDLLKKDKEILNNALSSGKISAEISYQKVLINYNDKIKNLKSQITISSESLDNAKKAKELTLRSLQNLINEANIGLSQAQKEYSKLTIHSPISGVIGNVFIDLGEEVFNGKKVFSIINNAIPEVKVSFDKNELSNLTLGDKATTFFDGKILTGTLVSLSNIADSNLKYTGIVVFDDNLQLIGSIIELTFKQLSDKILVPLNIVEIGNEELKGTLKRYNFVKKVDDFDVTLGNIYGEKIEILDLERDNKGVLLDDYDIITNDITEFDKNKFEVEMVE